MRIEYHRTLIADRVRNEAFYRALKAVIVPGKTIVADIGTGTGLLGLMAAKLGAKDVFMFETAEVAGVAAKLIKANRAKRCHLIPCHSTEFDDTLSADVIVSETLGNYALEEDIIDTIADARARFLKPGGHLIPEGITQYVAPVISPRINDELSAWDRAGPELKCELDLSFAKAMSFNNAYVRTLASSELLGGIANAAAWDLVDLTRDNRSARKGSSRWRVRDARTIYGLAVWWSADLGHGIKLSTAPDGPRTHWEQLYMPLLTAVHLKAGDTVEAAIKSRSSQDAGTHLAWTVTHLDGKSRVIAKHAHDLDKGYLP